MELCGIRINCFHVSDLWKDFNSFKLLVTVNAEAIVRAQNDSKLKKIINNHYASIDGQIPLWLYKLKFPDSSIDKVSGSDLIYHTAQWARDNHKRIFLLGGKEESNTGAVNKLSELYPNIQIMGFSPHYLPYPFPHAHNKILIEKIESFKPDILFVGFGMGKQEFWAYDNKKVLRDLGVKLIIGCGGTFEFVSGKIRRAPVFIQKSGLEGLWRLFQEFKWFRIKRILLSFKIFYYYLFPKISTNNT